MNVFSFTGNLGRDAKRSDVNGHAVLNFVVAVKSGFGQNEQTLWMDCALWGKQAEGALVDYLVKGQRVSVSGELGSREYQGNDGSTKTALTCRVNRIGLEGGSNSQSGGQQAQSGQYMPAQQQPRQQSGGMPQQPGGFDDFDDDIPF